MDFLNLKNCLATTYFQKEFDSATHLFLVTTVKKYCFGEGFINWTKNLLKNQECCGNLMMELIGHL